MSITDIMDNAKRSLEELKRNRRFKKANRDREETVQLQADIMKCRGQLEICRKDFIRSIKTQQRNIEEGRREGMDTFIHEQTMWNAALGYMLVRDAIFALKSVSSYDSVARAYEMLDAATKQMSGKKGTLSATTGTKSTKKRSEYGQITSASVIKEKEEILSGFFEQLKRTGDIEACMDALRSDESRGNGLLDALEDVDDKKISGARLEDTMGLADDSGDMTLAELDELLDTLPSDQNGREV